MPCGRTTRCVSICNISPHGVTRCCGLRCRRPPSQDEWRTEADLGDAGAAALHVWVHHVRNRMLLPLRGDCNLITGGPPCQSVSGNNRNALCAPPPPHTHRLEWAFPMEHQAQGRRCDHPCFAGRTPARDSCLVSGGEINSERREPEGSLPASPNPARDWSVCSRGPLPSVRQPTARIAHSQFLALLLNCYFFLLSRNRSVRRGLLHSP